MNDMGGPSDSLATKWPASLQKTHLLQAGHVAVVTPTLPHSRQQREPS